MTQRPSNDPAMKTRLFTPGPTPVPERVTLAMAAGLPYHRSPEFREVLRRVSENLRYVFQTRGAVLTLTCSGTGGMEALFQNLFSPGDTVVAVNGGKFGARWVEMPRTFGITAIEVAVPWGKAVTVHEVVQALQEHPETKGVVLTYSETSTGTTIDLQAIASAVRSLSKALVCVDAVTALGAHELRFDAWGIDACVAGSQKGLMIPPGLACIALSERAVRAIQESRTPRFYFDLRRALDTHATNDTPWTPAISLLCGLDEALRMIRTEGIERVWQRHRRLSEALRAGVKALGLTLFSESPSHAVTAVRVPDGIDWAVLNRALKKESGVIVAGGQGDFVGKIFRIAHLGHCEDLDIVVVVAALERALASAGMRTEPGAGVSAVLKVLAQ